jgi:hypothetical protein
MPGKRSVLADGVEVAGGFISDEERHDPHTDEG